MINRKNILSVLKSSTTKCYHSAVLTCFTFDPIFFNLYFMPVLRSRGVDNVIVFMDAGQYDSMMESSSDVIKNLQGYTLIRQQSQSENGVFHPKIFYLIGEEKGELFVGSGNLTYSGLSLNDEVWASFVYDGQNNMCLPIMAQVWDYLSQLTTISLVRFQIQNIEVNAKWLYVAKECKEENVEKDGIKYAFVYNHHNHPSKSILTQLQTAIGYEGVDKLTIVAPFYDEEASIARSLNAKQTILYVDPSNGRVPRNIPEKYLVYNWSLKNTVVGKLHAKIFQIETASKTILLMGSANATRKAFGYYPTSMNDEACILIVDHRKNDFVKELEIVPGYSLSLEELKKCENNLPDTNRGIYSVKIALAQLKDLEGQQVLSVELNKENAEETQWKLCVEDTNGQIQEFPFVRETQIGNTDIKPFIVFIREGSDVISNRCLVIDENEILKTLPKNNLGKLSQLLQKPDQWAKNIASILENVEFDDDDFIAYKAAKRSISKIEEPTDESVVVVREDFDKMPIFIKHQLACNKNLKIMDFFRGIFENIHLRQADKGVLSEEMETDEGFDEQILIEEEKEQQTLANRSNQINSFLKKSITQFKKVLDRIPIVFTLNRPLSKANVKLSSIPAIANDLIILERPSNPKTSLQRRQQFLELNTLACLVFRDGAQDEDPYRKSKILSNLKYFINKSLLLFAHYNWFKKENEMLVSVLNILYLMRHVTENVDVQLRIIENSLKNLIKEAQYNDLYIDDKSVMLVNRALWAYSRFFRNKREENLKDINTIDETDIVKVQNLCFATISNINLNTYNIYQYDYHLPIDIGTLKCASRGTISYVAFEQD